MLTTLPRLLARHPTVRRAWRILRVIPVQEFKTRKRTMRLNGTVVTGVIREVD